MRILLVHNFYDSTKPSGENVVFEIEKSMLENYGNSVEVFSKYNDEILSQGGWGKIKGALATPWNPFAARAIQRKISLFKPDVVHVHNTFPLLSPSIFKAIGHHAARVLTLHNYRLFCPAAIPMRRGKVCIECLDQQSAWPSIKYGCYRNSRYATLPLTLNVTLHRWIGTWIRQVDAFIVLSAFQKALMTKGGLPKDKIYIKPNFSPNDSGPLPWGQRKPYVVFVGRLTAEKGVEALIEGWRRWRTNAPELRIIGQGPLRAKLEQKASGMRVRFFGALTPEQAHAQIANAMLLILPSEWFEGFPVVVVEAFAFGTPVAVSNIGPLPSIVRDEENGIVFEPGDPKSLTEKVRRAWEMSAFLERLGEGARRTFESFYTEEENYRILMNVYEQAVKINTERRGS